jgi:hypothetical protein
MLGLVARRAVRQCPWRSTPCAVTACRNLSNRIDVDQDKTYVRPDPNAPVFVKTGGGMRGTRAHDVAPPKPQPTHAARQLPVQPAETEEQPWSILDEDSDDEKWMPRRIHGLKVHYACSNARNSNLYRQYRL